MRFPHQECFSASADPGLSPPRAGAWCAPTPSADGRDRGLTKCFR